MSWGRIFGLAALVAGIVAIVLIVAVTEPKTALTFAAIGVACAGASEVVS